MRAEALEAYRSLPVPDTTEEHWRFTDLRGFDPDAFAGEARAAPAAPGSMLELDVAAEAVITETGIEITRAPSEIRFEPLDEAHERLGSLVGWRDDKFAAHNAAAWKHGLLDEELGDPVEVARQVRRDRRVLLDQREARLLLRDHEQAPEERAALDRVDNTHE